MHRTFRPYLNTRPLSIADDTGMIRLNWVTVSKRRKSRVNWAGLQDLRGRRDEGAQNLFLSAVNAVKYIHTQTLYAGDVTQSSINMWHITCFAGWHHKIGSIYRKTGRGIDYFLGKYRIDISWSSFIKWQSYINMWGICQFVTIKCFKWLTLY